MLRRYLPTLILLLILLAVGGYSIAQYTQGPPLTRGGYVPTLSSDPAAAAVEALLFTAILGGVIFSTIGMGVFLAITFYRLTRLIAAHGATLPTGEVEAKPAGGPKAPAKGPAPAIPLSSDRSAGIFWAVVALIVVGFQVLRYWSNHEPLGYLPGFNAMLNMPLFRLPGTHINGLPPFVVGPGDQVTALHLLIGVLVNVVIATAVTGFIMARGFAKLSDTVNSAGTLKPTLPDRLIPQVEARIEKLRHPGPRRFKPSNPIDNFMIVVNVLLILVIGGIVALYVVPSYTSVAAVDQAVDATKIAALVTPTTQGTPGQSPLEALQAEFDQLPPGHADGGQQVYSSAGCSACHSLKPDERIVGPSFAGVATRAATRRPGYHPEIYLYESITNPNAYVVDGFPANTMPQTFKQTLSPQQLADVIAFLLTQK